MKIKNHNILLSLILLLVLLLGLSTINAADTTTNINKIEQSTTIMPENSMTEPDDNIKTDILEKNSITKNKNSFKEVKQDNEKQDIKTIKTVSTEKSTEKKSIKKASTHIVTNETFTDYFNQENNGTLTDLVNAGDTLDFQGKIFRNGSNIYINKPVNVISTTKDAYIDFNTTAGSLTGDAPGARFAVVNGGDYSNITGIYIHNTQLWVYNVSHVTFDNISAVVEDQRVGSGIGQTSIRANSTYITVKNSYFYTRNNGGSSTFVLAWGDYCTILNNTIRAEGNSGNLFYLTTANVYVPTGVIANSNNKIINNTIGDIGQSFGGIQLACVLSGSNNTLDGNKIASGISTQWGGAVSGNSNTIIINNEIYGSVSAILNSNYTIINNTLHNGKITITNKAIVINNSFDTLNLNSAENKIENNRINTINIKSNNNNLTNNNITGTVTITSDNNQFINNSVINDEEYTIKVTGKNNSIISNYLVSKIDVGRNTLILAENNTERDNKPISSTLIITDKTYSNYFDINGFINNMLITDYSIIKLINVFNNKSFKFNNINMIITGENAIINNGQIISKNSKLTISNITIKNNENITSSIITDSPNTIIEYVTIIHNTTKDVNEIYSTNISTIINNTNITIISPKSNTIKNITAITISGENNIIENNIINIITENNIKTNAIIINQYENNTSQKNNIQKNNITLKTNGIIKGIHVKTPIKSSDIKYNNINITTNNSVDGILVNNTLSSTKIQYNNITIISKNETNGVLLTDALSDGIVLNSEYIKYNYINVTGEQVNIVQVITKTIYTKQLRINYNNLIGNGLNITGLKFRGVVGLTSMGNNLTINGTNIIGVLFINTTKSSFSDGLFNTTKGIVAMIINSNNTLIKGLIHTNQPIYYINSTNTNIMNNQIFSNNDITIVLDSCMNFNVTNNYLVGNNYQVGGDKTVKVIGGENITVKNNKPNLVLVNNETYHTLFDKDGNYIGSEDVLIINSDLHGVDLIFNQYVNITSTNNSTIYGGTIKLTKNATKSLITKIKTNNTQIILEADNIQLTYSNIYQDNTKKPLILINNVTSTIVEYNNITGNTNNLQILLNNSKTSYITFNNITSLNQTKNHLIVVNNSNGGSIQYNYILSKDLFGNIAVEPINSTTLISSNTPNLKITNDNYSEYFNNEGEFIGNSLIDAIDIGSNIYNKDFKFNLTMRIYNPDKYTLYNTTIYNTNNESSLAIYDLIINNTNKPVILSNARSNNILDNIIYHESNDSYIICINNSKQSIIQNNNITTKGNNNIIFNCNGNSMYYSIQNNNIYGYGNNLTVANISNWTGSWTYYLSMNIITITSDMATIPIRIDNITSQLYILNNQIILKGDYKEENIPIIEEKEILGEFKIFGNYFETKNLVGNNAVVGEDVKIGSNVYNNIPTQSNYKTNMNITTLPSEIKVGTSYPITINVTDMLDTSVNGTIIIDINNKAEEVQLINGFATYNYTAIISGENTIKITYNDPTGKYENNTITQTVTVNKINTTLKANNVTGIPNERINIPIEFTDEDNNPLNGTITIKDTNNITLAIITIVNGKGSYSKIFKNEFDKDVTFIYEGNEIYNPTNTTIHIKIMKMKTKVVIEPVNAQIGDKINLKATVTDEDGNPVTEGRLVFKVNGKTIKDTNGNIIYATIKDGIATIENYTVPANWFKIKSEISAVYGGTNKYTSYRSEAIPMNITKKTATMTMTTNTTTAKPGQTIKITVKITEKDTNVNEGRVLFKVNGKTMRDNEGYIIYHEVKDGLVTIDYTIPENARAQDYTFTCVYGHKLYNRNDVNRTITVVKN